MSINREISEHIESIFANSAKTFSGYQSSVGLRCLSGCGACCLSQEISASTNEMLPTAFRILEEEGMDRVEELIEQLESNNSRQCIFYMKKSEDGTQGYCSNYETRPAVCRSFGVAAYKDKHGQRVMSICKRLKEAYPNKISALAPSEAPIIGEFAKQIYVLGQEADSKLLHINEALYEALKKVWIDGYYGSNHSEA